MMKIKEKARIIAKGHTNHNYPIGLLVYVISDVDVMGNYKTIGFVHGVKSPIVQNVNKRELEVIKENDDKEKMVIKAKVISSKMNWHAFAIGTIVELKGVNKNTFIGNLFDFFGISRKGKKISQLLHSDDIEWLIDDDFKPIENLETKNKKESVY